VSASVSLVLFLLVFLNLSVPDCLSVSIHVSVNVSPPLSLLICLLVVCFVTRRSENDVYGGEVYIDTKAVKETYSGEQQSTS